MNAFAEEPAAVMEGLSAQIRLDPSTRVMSHERDECFVDPLSPQPTSTVDRMKARRRDRGCVANVVKPGCGDQQPVAEHGPRPLRNALHVAPPSRQPDAQQGRRRLPSFTGVRHNLASDSSSPPSSREVPQSASKRGQTSTQEGAPQTVANARLRPPATG